MCSLVGALLFDVRDKTKKAAEFIFDEIWSKSHLRGRDGRGFLSISGDGIENSYFSTARAHFGSKVPLLSFFFDARNICTIGNLRAEPTTEYVSVKKESDQQPYFLGDWAIVHNGTIANDKDLRTHELSTKIDSAAIVEQLVMADTAGKDSYDVFIEMVSRLQGSYAILASCRRDPDKIFVAANYRPIWYISTSIGVFFASSRDFFPVGFVPQMFPPYSTGVFSFDRGDGKLGIQKTPLLSLPKKRRAVVVCSGGLDSVVAATVAKKNLGYEIMLLHFLYGCRAEGPEVQAVKNVAEHLDVPYLLFPLNVYGKDDSPLFDKDSKIAGGEAGAEFAYEWVPARNLLFLSVAVAYAEAHDFDTVILGNNLEEAGAYPDNEPEFIDRFNDLLPFAVRDGKTVHVEMPVGNLMKHEIVAAGVAIDAPLHLTWSCYRAGEEHCGTCGPCFMRKTAFRINGLSEVIEYQK